MGLIANGAPKCGNHFLVKACELLGVPATVNHIPFDDKDGIVNSATKHIFIKRDPRNLPISLLRAHGKQITAGMYLTKYRNFINRPLVDELMSYAGWLTDPKTFVVSFEALLKDDTELKRIATHLDVPYVEGAFEDLPSYTLTWVDADHSDYRRIWSDEIEAAWQKEGGAEVQKLFGY